MFCAKCSSSSNLEQGWTVSEMLGADALVLHTHLTHLLGEPQLTGARLALLLGFLAVTRVALLHYMLPKAAKPSGHRRNL